MKRLFVFAFVAIMLFAGCQTKVDNSFSFVLGAESVVEGESLPVSITFVYGPLTGYTMSSSVEEYDVSTATGTPTLFSLVDAAGVAASSVDFTLERKKGYCVDGLPAGTYRIDVVLSREGLSVRHTVVAVVQSADGPEGPGGDKPEEVPVEGVSLVGLGDGDVLVFEPGAESRYPLSWYPASATALDLVAYSSDPEVVAVELSGYALVVRAVAPGEAVVGVVAGDDVSVMVPVRVKAPDVAVTSFDLSGLQLEGGRLVLEDNDEESFVISWLPVNATLTNFSASSSDPSVASVSVSDGVATIKALYPGETTVTVAVDGGPSKSFIVRVHKDVVVTVSWNEPAATDAQIRTKTFPCYLVFSSDSDKAFPDPITWTVTMKGVVGVTGQDTQSVTSKENVPFYGSRAAQYDAMTNVLIPCYSIYRTSSFSLSVTLTLQYSMFLNPDYWTVSFDEVYREQEARIQEYITYILQ